MQKKEITEEFRVEMPHLLKIMVYPKSTSMCFVRGHIQNHRKMSKYCISGSLPSYCSSSRSSIVHWAPKCDLWYELRSHWTKCYIMVALHQGFCCILLWMDTPLLTTCELTADGCKTSFLNSYSSCSTSSNWWQLQKVDSALALNFISNIFSCQINGLFFQIKYYSSAATVTSILT